MVNSVREILPEIISQVVVLVASDEPEQQEIASRTVGELVRKFGERILGEIIPLLKAKSTSSDPRTRQGVVETLNEIMQNATETQREDHEDDIIAMVRVSLVDDEPNVRTAAAQAFDILQSELGAVAIDQTIPTLLEALRQPGKGSGTALQALQEVMSVCQTFQYLSHADSHSLGPCQHRVPSAYPYLDGHSHDCVQCQGFGIVGHCGWKCSQSQAVILGALVKTLEDGPESELAEAADEALKAILSSISDAEGLHTLMMLLIGWCVALL